MSAAARLLEKLDGVRQTTAGNWIAKCPAHDDRGPSLSIRDAGGKCLVHCFAGCAAADILCAVGLTLADLFDDREHRTGSKKHRPRVPATDCLLLASREVTTAAILAADFLDKRGITEDGWQRLAQCAARLGRLSDEVNR